MYDRFDGLALMQSSLCVYYRPMSSINVSGYTEYSAKSVIVSVRLNAVIILRDGIDVRVFPAYTLSAEVTCRAS